jgi:hypothetical protein
MDTARKLVTNEHPFIKEIIARLGLEKENWRHIVIDIKHNDLPVVTIEKLIQTKENLDLIDPDAHKGLVVSYGVNSE